MTEKVGLPMGIEDFERIRKDDFYYVDKTGLIKELLLNQAYVNLFTRPRRFGKTLNMSMVEKFFSVEYAGRGDLFQGLHIWEGTSADGEETTDAMGKGDKYRKLQGTYPVIFLSFADVKETTFQEARKKICKLLQLTYNKFDFLLKSDLLNENEKGDFQKISPEMENYMASLSLKLLSAYLSRYYGKKAIILLDEYDTPMQEAYINGYWKEMADFIRVFDTLTEVYRHRTCYSRLYRKEAEILSRIKNIPLDAYDEIVTDEEDVYGLLADNIREKPVRLYKDALLPLAKLYSLETHLKEALGKRVWLPCGGYLVIEPTEAMTVIDVNSGKAVGKGKKSKSDYLTVNLEAAGEVARQLRLRNYSGMIMVDFISMEKESDNRILLEKLDRFLREDKVPARLVDMTALGIVEITRKKVSRPLADFL